ncbi:3-methyl-2-oxobutanoate hydroxymethyltransferase [Sinorhizobium alkalisoli]|uniref:3-methyl-2-oxobutanoate hydroxymethyltransferase n=1 Tax=Sinorhizobium alkalisoli TaxID=1752398 RepID=A0A1E3VFL4_9HYPH|nr:3-methyl-2-oxobutanoate hydroxymethyltransferase [Sinorhizobium alkalisoli]MCA1491757.1 3-methyl-2-oxobutanoate hydroxymethyltransferase [Ensifer sp. NBAIM29]MCG5479249.1 3-methyl-2-oxobutanoate hydroxymethyltransferase [Sinorhizobium alkalisoli]ODR92383.1 3-methyl-2-oxobutanoate hydroxymethyltransferase [Sinorhizobium alkalisoli]QFI66940.1 3-methyl-2-oxobutanoate hydroxymethyltransferase [Sinorhizobium alkalisoli]
MISRKMTVADLRALKGKRQLVMLRVETAEDAAAAEQAGIDMISVPPSLLTHPDFRDAAPSLFCVASLSYGMYATAKEYLRAAFEARRAGADAVYCAASLRIVRRLAEERIPVCGHVGMIPSQITWTGGFKAVGKTVESAMEIWRNVTELEMAGAVMAEIEVVPESVAAEICSRTSLILMSMGAGAGCDGQYMFAVDILGSHKGHYPRHSKTYRNFAAEYDRLQSERIGAFRDFADDVARGTYPAPGHVVPLDGEILAEFVRKLSESNGNSR